MNGLEITVTLGAAVFAGTVLAPRLRMAPPLLLLLLGVALGFVPELRHIELHPEMVLLIFLPAMLFWESLTTSLRSIRRDFRGIMIMSTLLVVATAFAVAGIAVGGDYTALDVTGLVARSYLGGVAVGALVAFVAYLVLRPLRDATTI